MNWPMFPLVVGHSLHRPDHCVQLVQQETLFCMKNQNFEYIWSCKEKFYHFIKSFFHIQIFEVWQLLKLVLFEWTVNVWNARLHYDIHVYTRVWETRTQTPQSWLHYVTWSILFLHNRGFKGHSRHEIDQAFPLCYHILQAIKNWMVGRPGNEATLKPTEIIPGPNRFNPKTWIPVRLRQCCSMPLISAQGST